ncbi:MAG TPA: chromosomal replication initiator protein DnaA [Burkholderiales bacterium]|nr:chromosomal replication initiator protein DnaA [Burkholderiales bacterium]
MNGLWQACLSQLEKELPAQQFNTWIRPLNVDAEGVGDGELRLLAPNRFVLQWVKERFLSRIETLGSEFGSAPLRVSLSLQAVEPAAPNPAINGHAAAAEAAPEGAAARPAAQPRAPRGVARNASAERANLIPEFNFDSFVGGKANQLARAAALQVAEHPGTSYNPLFIYGGVGLGKTHLIHAVGNFVLSQHPDARVRYLHASEYVSDVVRAYQQKSFEEFKRYYHSLDLLLIDDIQFFAGKDRTQEEFFYAFNALIEAHKQVIITCDTYPKDLSGLEERLKSRFSWGLTVAIEPPEQEMRVAIVLKKADAVSFKLDEDVAFFIAKHIRSNVRELEGALKSIIAFARFNGKDINLDTAKEALKDLLMAQNRQITVDNIQKTVADYYKLKVSDLLSKKRVRNIARPRQIAMTLAKDLTQMSLPEIGDAFGGRDHTTVLHACRTIAAHREKNHDINRDYHVLEQVLKG